jgi:Outer membrane protein beta-barrel domain
VFRSCDKHNLITMKFYLLFSFSLLTVFLSFAQEEPHKKFISGFWASGNASFLQSKGAKPKELQLNSGMGFGLGILADYRFNEKIALSSRAGLSFHGTSTEYKNALGEVVQSSNVYKQCLDFSLLGVYSFRTKKNKPYLVFGPTIVMPLRPKETNASTFPYRTTLAIDLGFGFDRKLKHFHFAPELKYSYGLNNMNASPLIEKLYFHRLTLAFHFKG